MKRADTLAKSHIVTSDRRAEARLAGIPACCVLLHGVGRHVGRPGHVNLPE